MLDKNILRGGDEWVVEILQEAKDPRYDLIRDKDNITSVGFVSPFTYTNRHSYDGNRRHTNAVQGFAKIWNEIRKDKSDRKDRRIPKIAQYSIDALDNAKFQNMDIDE